MNPTKPWQSSGRRLVGQFHHNQSGAVALLVMAALLIVFMISMVIYDAGAASRDKLQVAAAADSAAWSQSAVEARSMNMIAFTNVGKRITFGMTSYYNALWISYTALLALAIVVAVAACVVAVLSLGTASALCTKATEFAVEVALIMAQEAPDLIVYSSDLLPGYFKNDVKAFDAYQKHMISITPWWGWAEASLRGARNGATFSSTFPVPKQINLPGSNTSYFGNTGMTDSLPVAKRNINEAYTEMCKRVFTDYDIAMHVLDFNLKTCMGAGCSNWKSILAQALATLFSFPSMIAGCAITRAVFGEDGQPYEMKTYTSQEQWLLESSNMAFAYRSTNNMRPSYMDKYKYMSGDYTTGVALQNTIYKASGTWSMSRSEISFQDGAPNMWRPSWTARMRPIALPSEWSALGGSMELKNAWRDVFPYMVVGAAVMDLAGGNLDWGSLSEVVRVELGMRGLGNAEIDGIPR